MSTFKSMSYQSIEKVNMMPTACAVYVRERHEIECVLRLGGWKSIKILQLVAADMEELAVDDVVGEYMVGLIEEQGVEGRRTRLEKRSEQ
ncbi:unnamed protein product [Dibothriocephalus latus]|uniref:Uncharacterized protein n=1 Tax=Dibothriocephalus latus TaxID=60516 RepID=A0A3P7LP15_DIBLA|nr:unnamed protein product [Dibothriocephalus latus]